MGQALVTPIPATGLKEMVNLTKEDLESLWTSYNLLGEGWSLDFEQFSNIFYGEKQQ